MRKAAALGLALLFVCSAVASAADEEHRGQLVDVEFMNELNPGDYGRPDVLEKVRHFSGEEMLRRSEDFGMLVDGRFYRFDRTGNQLAREILSRGGFRTDFRVTATGTVQGEVMRATTVEDR